MDASDEARPYVYFIHGIRTYADWIPRFRQHLRDKHGIESGYRSYGRFSLLKFLFPRYYLRDIIDLIRNDLKGLESKKYSVTVVAHSFGAYIIYRLLRRDPFLKIEKLVLCGAVIQRRARWIDVKLFYKQISGQIINLCGKRDPFPPLAELACRRFGATGVAGAGDPSVDDYFFPIGHSEFFTDEFLDKYFSPAMCDVHFKPKLDSAPFAWYVSAILYICSHKTITKAIIASAAMIIGAIVWFRPEFACGVMKCSMNVYREDDYRGSFMENGTRNFSHVVRSSYALNFLASEYLGRAGLAKDENMPKVFELDERHAKKPVEGYQSKLEPDFNLYDISVYGYHADSVFEFNGGDAPSASSYIGNFLTKNLTVEIRMPQGVEIEPCDGHSFSSGIFPKEFADVCHISPTGYSLTCTDINLPARQRLYYNFKLKGWDNKGDAEECKKR